MQELHVLHYDLGAFKGVDDGMWKKVIGYGSMITLICTKPFSMKDSLIAENMSLRSENGTEWPVKVAQNDNSSSNNRQWPKTKGMVNAQPELSSVGSTTI